MNASRVSCKPRKDFGSPAEMREFITKELKASLDLKCVLV